MAVYIRAVYPVKYSEYVEPTAQNTELSEALVYAVIRTESGFDKNAVSYLDAKGLMQLMPETLDWVSYRLGEGNISDYDILFDPQKNIYYGCHLLELLYDEFGSTREVLAAYHAGAGNVNKWLKNEEYSSDGETLKKIPFKDTEKYVRKVMLTAEIYSKIYKLK